LNRFTLILESSKTIDFRKIPDNFVILAASLGTIDLSRKRFAFASIFRGAGGALRFALKFRVSNFKF